MNQTLELENRLNHDPLVGLARAHKESTAALRDALLGRTTIDIDTRLRLVASEAATVHAHLIQEKVSRTTALQLHAGEYFSKMMEYTTRLRMLSRQTASGPDMIPVPVHGIAQFKSA